MTVGAPLYLRIMGTSWNQLAAPLQSLHSASSTVCARGQLRIEHGRHPGVRLLARLLRLPHPSAAADTSLVITARADGEHWERTFSDCRFATRQYKWQDELAERYGVLQFRFRLRVAGGSLVYVQRQAAVVCGRVRLPIPTPWAPRVDAREEPAGSRHIHLEVRVELPGVGLLISYAGLIEVEGNER